MISKPKETSRHLTSLTLIINKGSVEKEANALQEEAVSRASPAAVIYAASCLIELLTLCPVITASPNLHIVDRSLSNNTMQVQGLEGCNNGRLANKREAGRRQIWILSSVDT